MIRAIPVKICFTGILIWLYTYAESVINQERQLDISDILWYNITVIERQVNDMRILINRNGSIYHSHFYA